MSEIKKQEETELILSQEDYDKLITDLEQFEENFYKELAKDDKYEIVPTTLENGKIISPDQVKLLARECRRLGCTVLYKVDVSTSVTLLVNPQSMKIGYITEGVH